MKIQKQKIKGLLTQTDLESLSDLMGGLMDKQAAILASKKDLKDEITGLETRMDTKLNDLETNLKDYMHQGFEAVMEGMDSIAEKLTEKQKFDRLVEWAKEVGEKVGVKPRV
jgi:predicted  nucleic acid-binding Zn-ribbon protein